MMSEKKLHTSAKWLLILGFLSTVISPLLLPYLANIGLGEYGTIGDSIGGITNPISQLVGSFLLYLALKAQLIANNITQKQIEEDNKKQQKQYEINQLELFFRSFEQNIKDFSYEFNNGNQKQILYGRRAIKSFLNDLEEMNVDIHNDEDILMYDGVRELLSILKSAEEIFNILDRAEAEENFGLFYGNLLQHELLFNVFPYQDLDDDVNLKKSICSVCGNYHSHYPPIIYNKLEGIKNKFK